ncbi:MAG TPA: sigma-54 dependent transcriptional regulator [Thermodesulfovibrionales bacterium]|nr:sigma-54 dependent transcriptional regulator [Thermodesulfovibrionales bacterium]
MKKGKVFLVDDDELIVSMLSRALRGEGYEVNSETVTFTAVVDKIAAWLPDVVLLDLKLPSITGLDILEKIKTNQIDTQVVMLTSDDHVETAIKCMKLGAADYLTKPFNIDEVKIVVNNIVEKRSLKSEVSYLRRFYSEAFRKDIIGESPAMAELKQKAEKVARSNVSTVLITGESGTGKELVARYIHSIMYDESGKGFAPFIAINCTALPETLLESELFGYEKGAFTDAKAEKKGIFELAHGGTILLDEIGDMKLSLQGKLLRVLEERTIRRIGGQKEIPIEVTVIATTNRNLSEAVDRGEFRMDLFYRLNIFALSLPPLRERKEDIPLLAQHYLTHFTSQYKNKVIKGFSPRVEQVMYSYRWPGNVREMKNVIERIVVLETSELIMPEHLPREMLGQAVLPPPHASARFVLPEAGISLDELERDLITQALERAKSNKTVAAKLLNITYDSLRYQIKKFGLEE